MDREHRLNPSGAAAVRLLLLTGCRKSEILSLRWDWVDFECGLMRLADSKSGAKVVPLAAAAVELLGKLPRSSGYVLPAAKGGGVGVGGRVTTPSGRLDLAADVIGAMVHPKDKTGRQRRRSALAETLLGMSDRDDEPEALSLVKGWFRRAGGFKTASEKDPYNKQQNEVLRQIPKMLNVGMALDLVWAMDAHHRETLPGVAKFQQGPG